HAFGHGLVHCQTGCHRATARIGQFQQLQRTLQCAVFAIAAMQGDERTIESLRRQVGQRTLSSIKQMGIYTLTQQRRVHAFAGHDGHLALCGTAAVQHSDLAQSLHIDGRFSRLSHANSPTKPGTLLIEPAPITTTTSPSRTKSTMAWGNSVTSSTNK